MTFHLSLRERIHVHNLHGLQKTERVQKGSRKSGESKVFFIIINCQSILAENETNSQQNLQLSKAGIT